MSNHRFEPINFSSTSMAHCNERNWSYQFLTVYGQWWTGDATQWFQQKTEELIEQLKISSSRSSSVCICQILHSICLPGCWQDHGNRIHLPGWLIWLWFKFCNCLFMHTHRSYQIRLAVQVHSTSANNFVCQLLTLPSVTQGGCHIEATPSTSSKLHLQTASVVPIGVARGCMRTPGEKNNFFGVIYKDKL